jgi:CheY-like chemotaxis protein
MSRILIVEDEPIIRRFLAEELADTGHLVITASNGAQALDYVRTQPTDIVLLDLLLPVMDGLQFLRERANQPQLQRVPVVVLSAAGIEALRLASKLHATAVLAKPLDLDVLSEVIDHVLGTARPAEPAPADADRRPIGTCPICGRTAYAETGDALGVSESVELLHAARRAHIRSHAAAEIARAPLWRRIRAMPGGRRILSRWVDQELHEDWGDQDRRGVHAIDAVLDSPALHRLWQDAVRCGWPACRHASD